MKIETDRALEEGTKYIELLNSIEELREQIDIQKRLNEKRIINLTERIDALSKPEPKERKESTKARLKLILSMTNQSPDGLSKNEIFKRLNNAGITLNKKTVFGLIKLLEDDSLLEPSIHRGQKKNEHYVKAVKGWEKRSY
jgi:hypothetical protein